MNKNAMNLPKHVSLCITHQPHAAYNERIAQYFENRDISLDVNEFAEMVKTGEVWLVQWYPTSPVGLYEAAITVAAATLERALELARDLQK